MIRNRTLARWAAGFVIAATPLAIGVASASSEDTPVDTSKARSTNAQSTNAQSTNTQSTNAQSTFKLTIKENERTRTVRLDCAPDGGTHPRAEAACDELRAVNGHFQRLDDRRRESDTGCTRVYRNVQAEAVGKWQQRRISYQVSVGNQCTLEQQTGAVFDF